MGNEKILIVEDEKLVVLHIEESLKGMGYSICGAVSSGEDAIRQAKKTKPDLVLMDIKLKGKIDGITAAGKIRERIDVPIIYLTAYADDKTLKRAKMTEPFGYLLKPFNDKELHSIIQTSLYRSKMDRKLKESEEKYRSLFANMIDGFAYHEIVVDADNKPVDYVFLEVNDAFEEYTGLKRKDILGKKVTKVIPGIKDSDPDLISVYGKVALTGEPAGFELYFEPFDKWYSVRAYSQKKGYFAVTFEEITGRKKSEEDLKRAYNDLKTLEKMKDEFLSNISHELKTPLTSIKSAQELLMEAVEGDQRELITIIDRNVDRLDALIGDILCYTDMQQLPLELKKEELDLSRMIDTAVKVLSMKAFDMEVTIDTTVNEGLKVYGDKKSVYKVMFSLLDNAIKFNKKGGLVTLEGMKLDEGRIRVTISDTGIGVPKERQNKIFDRFYQLDGSTKRKYPGAGMGLSLAKAIVEKHSGKIWVESEVGKGSKFIFEIPKDGETQIKELVHQQADLKASL